MHASETEWELRVAVALMMGFYVIQLLIELSIAVKMIPEGSMGQSLSMAHDAWLLFFGLVGGIFRGMAPQSGAIVAPVRPGAALPPGSFAAALPDDVKAQVVQQTKTEKS